MLGWAEKRSADDLDNADVSFARPSSTSQRRLTGCLPKPKSLLVVAFSSRLSAEYQPADSSPVDQMKGNN